MQMKQSKKRCPLEECLVCAILSFTLDFLHNGTPTQLQLHLHILNYKKHFYLQECWLPQEHSVTWK